MLSLLSFAYLFVLMLRLGFLQVRKLMFMLFGKTRITQGQLYALETLCMVLGGFVGGQELRLILVILGVSS